MVYVEGRMKKSLLFGIVTLGLIAIIIFKFEYASASQSGIMTIILNHENVTYYYQYNLNTNKYKEVYHKSNNDYSDGIITKDQKTLYYTDKGSNNKYNLYKMDIKSDTIYQITQGLKIDTFLMGDNKIFGRARQDDHRNNNLVIINLGNNQINFCDKNKFDSDIYNLYYNQYNHKIYTIERSIKALDSTRLPSIPTHRIMEYNEGGGSGKELFQVNGYIHNISVSKDGNRALISVTFDSSLDKIYLVNLSSSSKSLLLESKSNYVVSKASFSPDEKGFYFLATTPDSKIIDDNPQHIVKSKGIYYYNFLTQKTSEVFSKEFCAVNDFNIQY